MICLIEKTGVGYKAYVLEVPGCVCSGATLNEAAERVCVALRRHFAENPSAIPLTFRIRSGPLTVESGYPTVLH